MNSPESSPNSLALANICKAEGDTGTLKQIMTWSIISDSMLEISFGRKSQLIPFSGKQGKCNLIHSK